MFFPGLYDYFNHLLQHVGIQHVSEKLWLSYKHFFVKIKYGGSWHHDDVRESSAKQYFTAVITESTVVNMVVPQWVNFPYHDIWQDRNLQI